jgi:general secretion pathway protein E
VTAPTLSGAMPLSPIAPDAVAAARKAAMQSGRRLVEVLEEQSGLAPETYLTRLGATVGILTLAMAELDELRPATDVLPLIEGMKHECLAVRGGEGELVVVLGDPFNPGLKAWIEERIPQRFALRLVHPRDLAARFKQLEGATRAVDRLAGMEQAESRPEIEDDDISFLSLGDSDSPVVQFVNATLFDALKAEASDIHFETSPQGLTVKYRLDGVLVQAGSIQNRETAEQVISRIKVMSDLDISERRVPQDGRFKASVEKRHIDFRVSVMPSVYGEDSVIRILDKRALVSQTMELRLDGLGFEGASIDALRKLSREAYGMLLVTGPTGSGKTTTLYAAISEIKTGEDKIVTIEDPVEYQLQGVLQIPVNEKKGLTFARGLRSILRHDPDKILVGEIRDSETAEIAVQAALTGHLVFTTVHANNVFDVIGRFTHMGVDPYSFVSAMSGIVAQRLLRVVCGRCVTSTTPDAALIAGSGLRVVDLSGFDFRIGKGCGHCRGTGYRGRKAIAEVLLMTDELRELIVARAPMRTLKEAASALGTVFLRQAALELVKKGETTLQEINRVTLV